MLDLAIHATDSPIPLADISQRQGISLSYLEQLFARLRRQGLVKSARGPGGGYRLNRVPDEITIVQVLNAIDEKIDTTRCEGRGDCQDGQPCLTHELWCDLSKQISDFLSRISLGELVERNAVREVSARQDTITRAHPVTMA